ncbi:MAG: hypothetical protein U9O24_04685 [Campylobacterota bacterium]|nr:hypothetical protein [Campylobacterota bacterium]
MLNLNTKINYFKKYLEVKNNSYADAIKDEIYLYFFDLYGNIEDMNGFLFLDTMQTKKDIEYHIDFLVSKIIMNEHQDGLNEIIYEYS